MENINLPKPSDQMECGIVAGALVHTPSGPVPIELIQAGDQVFARHVIDGDGDSAYECVVGTVMHPARNVILISYIVDGDQSSRHLVVTNNLPFWINGKGWMPADGMYHGEFVSHRQDRETYVYMAHALFNTQTAGVGWTCHPGLGAGTEVDFRSGRFEVTSEESWNGEDSGAWGFVTRDVYHLQLESPGAVFVGDVAVWAPGQSS
jgi:hypothetical protein